MFNKMMLTLIGVCYMFCLNAEAEPISTKSVIDEVTVYLDHALIKRSAGVDCQKGSNEIVFKGLPPELLDNSIRVSSKGAAVRGVRLERVFLERAEEEDIRKLEDEIQQLRDEETALRDEQNILLRETDFLNTIRDIYSRRSASKVVEGELKLPDVESISKLMEMFSAGRKKNVILKRELEKKLRVLAPKLNAKVRKLNEERTGIRLEEKKVIISLDSSQGGKADIRFSYLLPGAMWFPSYDVRADLDKNGMELIYYAIIQQATGEDWSNAKLTLSASRPAQRSAKPVLSPWLLGQATIPGRSVNMPGPNVELVSGEEDIAIQNSWGDMNVNRIQSQYRSRGSKMKKAHYNLLGNVGFVQRLQRTVLSRGTSVSFPVSTRETVRTDGKAHRTILSVEKFNLDTSFNAVPALSLSTYVTGKTKNTSKYPLLPGNANVYLGGDLIGKSSVDFVAPGEHTEFYLGVEESIKITRKVDGKLSSLSSFGKKHRMEAAFSIEIENYKSHEIEIHIEEALPVSEDKQIKVKHGRKTPEPVRENRGIATWTLNIPSEEKKIISFNFLIEYPREMVQKVRNAPRMRQAMDMVEMSLK